VTAVLALAISACVATLGACTPPSEPAQPAAAGSADNPLEVTLPATPVSGEVPSDLLDAIITDLVEQEKLRREDIEVERAESAVWPDGSLGCPKPDEMYTQAQVPGYWIVLRVGERQYDYRASASGQFRRCSNALRRQLPVG
jgi:hypothetical protein